MAPVTTTTEAPTEAAPVEHPAIAQLREIELRVMTGYTLADAIREGSQVTKQAVCSWGDTETACTISAAYLAARARGFIPARK